MMPSRVQDFAGALGEAHLAAVIEEAIADAGRLLRFRIDMGDVRDVDRRLALDDAARLARPRRRMALHHVDTLHADAVLRAHDAQHLAALAFVPTGQDDHLVALLDLEFRHHSTSGASETIFMNLRARSSRVTGPKMRVPIGSSCAVISTAALRSKRIDEPSGRRIAFAVRTITALCTSPFFTRPRGMASFTETTMTSPTVAVRRLLPPSTLMHWTRFAPELSATSRLVCIWIMARYSGVAAALAERRLRRAGAGAASSFAGTAASLRCGVSLPSTIQRFDLEIGRHSSIRTISPVLYALVSSCAAYFFEREMNFL